MSKKSEVLHAGEENTSISEGNKHYEKESQYRLIYSLAGLILGIACIIGAIVILINGIIVQTIRSPFGAVVGIFLSIAGLFIIWLTRFGGGKKETDQHIHSLHGWIWSIHTEAQNLQHVLSEIEKKCELFDEPGHCQEVKTAIEEAKEIFMINGEQAKISLEKLKELMEKVPVIHDQFGDKITKIENLWEKASRKWEKLFMDGNTPTKGEILGSVSNINELLGKVIYHACLVAIPARIDQHLEKMRVGQPLDFHETFKDKMPQKGPEEIPEYSKKILNYIYLHPAIIWGAVDVKNGLIFKASPKLRRRYLSYILTMWAPFLGVFLIPLLLHYTGDFFNLHTWWFMKQSIPDLIAGCLFVTVGGFAHILVDVLKQESITFKQIRAGVQKPSLLLQNWLIWLHVKELTYSIGVLSIWVGFLILVFYFKDIKSLKTAFLIGYCIDSVIDIFLERFREAVSTDSESLIGQIF